MSWIPLFKMIEIVINKSIANNIIHPFHQRNYFISTIYSILNTLEAGLHDIFDVEIKINFNTRMIFAYASSILLMINDY